MTLNGASSPADASLMAAMLTHSAEALSNPVGRHELLQWIAGHADGPEVRCDCNELAGSLVLCLQDKMAAVRTLAEGVLTSLIAKGLINRGAVDKATRDLAPAAKRALQAPIERMLSSFGTKSIGGASVAAVEPALAAPVEAAPVPAASKRATVAKAAAPVAASAATVSRVESVEEPADAAFPFKKSNKAKRNDEFYKQNWPQPPEDIGDNELGNLKREWETQVTNSDIIHVLFPHQKFGMTSQELYMNGAAELMTALQQSAPLNAIALAHTDFILRWCAFVLCTRETTQGTLKVLQVITAVFELHRSMGIPLHDAEAGIILPHLIDKSGHKSERHKNAFKSTLEVAEVVCVPGKLSTHLLQGLGCKNKKTRAVCLEELEHVVAAHGYTPLGRSGIKEVCTQFDSSDVGVRNAALDLAYALYVNVGADTAKLYKLLGEVTDKAKSLIAGRIKERNKTAPTHPPPAPAATQSVMPPHPPIAAAPVPAASRPAPKLTSTNELAADRSVVLRGGSKLATDSIADNFEGDVAFKLEMTPDGSEATPPSHRATDRTPVAEAVKVSLFGKGTPESVRDVSVENVYAEIAGKVNNMITLYTDYVTKSRESNSSISASSELITACDDCREYMKMLHAMVMGNWAKNGTSGASTADDEAVLLQNAEGLILMIITCMSLALEGIGVSSRRATDMPVASALDVDVSLMSVCLATLHALVKHPGVVGKLSNGALIELTADCVLSISHDKLTKTSLGADAKEASEQMHRVLLLIMAKAAQEAGVARMVNAVVQSLFQCISEVDHASLGTSTVTRRVLPPRCAKPLSKLLLKVLSDECRQHRPFVRLPTSDVSSMLLGLHMFFSNHPGDLKGDDTPYCAAKTVLSQLVKSIGAPSILMTLQQSLDIQPSSFICM